MDIVFLDIDGVLNNFNDYKAMVTEDNPLIKFFSKNNLFFFLDALKTIKKKRDIKIVISSSWRQETYEDFIQDLKDYAHGRDKEFASYLHKDWRTPKLSKRRGEEVMAWLAHHVGEIDKYICLDDDSDYAAIQPLLLIDDSYGFGDRENKIMIDYFCGNANDYDKKIKYGLNFLKRVVRNQELFIKCYL